MADKRQQSKRSQERLRIEEPESDENFAFIAGTTEGGVPFGLTWEEKAAMEREEARMQQSEGERMSDQIREVSVNMADLEFAIESQENFRSWLDVESGRVVSTPNDPLLTGTTEEMEAEMEEIDSAPFGRFVSLEMDWYRPGREDALEFIQSIEERALASRLTTAMGRRSGAFRAFHDILQDHPGESERWHHFARGWLWNAIAAALLEEGIRLVYQPLPPLLDRGTRLHLLAGGIEFVIRVHRLSGIERVALIGSMAESKKEPKDIDFLLTITGEADLKAIASAGRKLKGHAQQLNRGADIFLSDPSGRYLGRTCPWRECAPGIRRACEAEHCGRYLYDDLHLVTLSREVVTDPPAVIWPNPQAIASVPEDVRKAFNLS